MTGNGRTIAGLELSRLGEPQDGDDVAINNAEVVHRMGTTTVDPKGATKVFREDGSELCTPTTVIEVAGIGCTSSFGAIYFHLSTFECFTGGRPVRYLEPVTVQATARSTKARYVSTWAEIEPHAEGAGDDVRITISAWDPTGELAHFTNFFWECRVGVEFLDG